MRQEFQCFSSFRHLAGPLLLLAFAACSSDPTPSTMQTGGTANASGGNNPSGGAIGASGNAPSGGMLSTGGSSSTGGLPTNGGAPSAGGSPALGGASAGGSTNAGGSAGATLSGGTPGGGGTKATSGGTPSAGGTSNPTGGTSSTGGSKAAGGTSSTGGSKASGGTTSTGGSSSTGGTGGANTSCPNADPTELALVSAWLNNSTATGALPSYAYANIKTNFPAGAAFNTLACSIAMSCKEFAPMETNWLRKCEAVITSAIVAESSYNPKSVVVDTYATRSVGGVTANDPTIGLLQIRFSSTVHDYNYYGPLAKMASIGCSWPSALTTQADTASWWATNGGTTYLAFQQDPACNIALATWYYFYNATSNGGASAVWISDYCAGRGIAGTMVVGLLSHLMGGNFARPADASNAYPWGIECCAGGNPTVTTCTGCTGRAAAFLGIGTANARPSPDPFLEQLAPEPSKYCK
jgi:hypothetical protein